MAYFFGMKQSKRGTNSSFLGSSVFFGWFLTGETRLLNLQFPSAFFGLWGLCMFIDNYIDK